MLISTTIMFNLIQKEKKKQVHSVMNIIHYFLQRSSSTSCASLSPVWHPVWLHLKRLWCWHTAQQRSLSAPSALWDPSPGPALEEVLYHLKQMSTISYEVSTEFQSVFANFFVHMTAEEIYIFLYILHALIAFKLLNFSIVK